MKFNFKLLIILILLFFCGCDRFVPAEKPTQDEKVVINRFSLHKTDNMWNFILLDNSDGRVWHCQYTVKENNYNFCSPIDISSKILPEKTYQYNKKTKQLDLISLGDSSKPDLSKLTDEELLDLSKQKGLRPQGKPSEKFDPDEYIKKYIDPNHSTSTSPK